MSHLSVFFHKYLAGWKRYKYLLAILFFLVVTFAADREYNLYQYYLYVEKIRNLEQEIDRYRKEADESRKKLDNLRNDREWLERFAREEYFMKKENEDIFIIRSK
jgi:cell division protein FtsB